MADEQQTEQHAAPSVDRQTIREALAMHLEARRQEEQEAERAARRQERNQRAKRRKQARIDRARERKTAAVRAANEAQARVARHVAEAGRSLRAALRAAQEVSFPRHSEEGRRQQQTVRSLEESLGSLRRVGRGSYDEDGVDIDLDLDLDL